MLCLLSVKLHRGMKLLSIALGALLLASAGNESLGDKKSPEKTISAKDVHARVALVRSELDALRRYMGKPRNEQPEIDVRLAAPREVYFQALTMLQNAERLCFEHTREQNALPSSPEGQIGTADVLQLVDATLECIRRVQDQYGLERSVPILSTDSNATPSDVFRSVVQADRQLNLLLERRVAPSDVYEQVTLAVGYCSRLLEHFPGATTLPVEPEFEPNKSPSDVYRRLLICMDRIHRIGEVSSVEMLKMKANEESIAEAEPGDVHHVASLIVSELAHLHSRLPAAVPPREVYYVGRKFPSHVYQRAGILERQLIELENRIEKNPEWISFGGEDKFGGADK